MNWEIKMYEGPFAQIKIDQPKFIFADEKAPLDKMTDKNLATQIFTRSLTLESLVLKTDLNRHIENTNPFFKIVSDFLHKDETEVRKKIKKHVTNYSQQTLDLGRAVAEKAGYQISNIDSKSFIHLLSCKNPSNYIPNEPIKRLLRERVTIAPAFLDMIKCLIVADLFKINISYRHFSCTYDNFTNFGLASVIGKMDIRHDSNKPTLHISNGLIMISRILTHGTGTIVIIEATQCEKDNEIVPK